MNLMVQPTVVAAKRAEATNARSAPNASKDPANGSPLLRTEFGLTGAEKEDTSSGRSHCTRSELVTCFHEQTPDKCQLTGGIELGTYEVVYNSIELRLSQ